MNFLCKPGRRVALPAVAVLVAGLAGGCATLDIGNTPDVTNVAAPGFESVSAGSNEDFIMNVGRRTYFSKGSAKLDDTAKRTLDAQAAWLSRNPRWLVKLQGHADDPGNLTQNRNLSQRRADAVMAYLASKGVDKSRMWSKGYAKERLVRDCVEIECKAQNRRVVSNLRTERET